MFGRKKDREVKIPAQLYKKLEKRAKRAKFDSVEDYIIHVLENETQKTEEKKKDEEKIKERLRALGYLE